MKTIDEAAKEIYSYNVDEFTWISDEKRDSFITGVEFAQRWIPVEEELPEKQGCYFVKVKNSFPKNCDIIVAEFYEDNKTFYSESSDYPIKDAISWRPIELK